MIDRTKTHALTGYDAIRYAEAWGMTVSKYADPIEEESDELTVGHALEIARDDPSLVYYGAIKHRIPRDGDRDLTLSGWLLGEGYASRGEGYYTLAQIYLTESGRYVAAIEQGHDHVDRPRSYRASPVCDTPEEVYQWLLDDCGGSLGEASKEAWEQACLAYKPMADQATEVVR